MPSRSVLTAVLCVSALAAGMWAGAMENPFFAMDTGTRDAAHQTPQAQAKMLAELGYAGIGWTGVDGLAELLPALDARQLKLFTIYLTVDIDADPAATDPKLLDGIRSLKSRDAIIWLNLKSATLGVSAPEGDDRAVGHVKAFAAAAKEAGARVALYPHHNCWLEKPEDALRVIDKAGMDNVGLTLNLYHWLCTAGEKDLRVLLQRILPKLYVVTINGSSREGSIETLDKGDFDLWGFLRALRDVRYAGPIALQGYGIGGDASENLKRSMAAWNQLSRAEEDGWLDLFADANFDAWRKPIGAWGMCGDAVLDLPDAKKLAAKPGVGVALNGPDGKTTHLVSKIELGDVEAHVEFMMAKGSNSGVYLQGRYEVQILDSFGVEKPEYGDCGGIYQRWREEPGIADDQRGYEGRAPKVNASRKSGEWQSFDIVFRAPRFDDKGNKLSNAVFVKVLHNGQVIHENQEVTGPTRAALFNDEQPTGPLMLQGDHGPVAFRNIRVRGLREDPYQRLLAYDYGQSREAFFEIERETEGASAEQGKAIEAKLIGALKAPGATVAAKQFACRMLGRVGSPDAIPALAALLPDEKLSDSARMALENMPGPAVDQALLAALPATSGAVKAGVINSLGERRQETNVEPLVPLLGDADASIAQAAAAALGKTGGDRAITVLAAARAAAAEPNREAFSRAYLECANALMAQGNAAKAAAIFDEVFAAPETPAVHSAAYLGRVRARGPEGAVFVCETIKSNTGALQADAARLIRELPGPAATEQFSNLLMDVGPEPKKVLLSGLAERGDVAARPAIVALCKDPDESVRVAALDALGQLGDASTVPMLVEIATIAIGKDRNAARNALARLHGKEVDVAIGNLLNGADKPHKSECLHALAARQASAMAPAVIALAEHADEDLRIDAIKTLGQLAGMAELPRLVGFLAAAPGDIERATAEDAVVALAQRVSDPARTAPIADALAKTDKVPAKCALLRALGKIADDAGLDALRAAAKDANEEIRDTAARALSLWPTPSPLADLRALAESGPNDVLRVLALRAYIRMLGLPSNRPEVDTLKGYVDAMALAKQADEKKQVLGGVSMLKSLDALKFAESLAADPELQTEAVAAALKLCATLADGQSTEVTASLQRMSGAVQEETLKAKIKAAQLSLFVKRMQTYNIAPQGRASSPDGLEKNGGAGGDQAAIDGNLDTYWDEEDGKPLYVLQVDFDAPREVGAISVVGYQHQDFAPKNFEVVCDGNVVTTVQDAVYTDNLLFVDFPKVACKTLTLRITASYGGSPAIRELGIYAVPPVANK